MWATLAACPAARAGRDRGRVADLPRRRVRPRRQLPHRTDPQLAAGEGAQAVDGLAWAPVGGRPGLEQRQRPLGAVGGPAGQRPAVLLAERRRARPAAPDRQLTSAMTSSGMSKFP
jgi:hypothetical protein